MSTDMSLEVIKLTQDNLGKFIKKPPLTEKLLKKPPFRFLHDIVTTIIRTTGFFDGLFSEEELVPDNVKDRESKIAFLQKIIEVVNLVTESSLTVRPSKVIAGLEPEKTNELLQKISYALEENLSSKQAVEVVANAKNTKNVTESKPSKSKSKSEKEQNNRPTKTLKSEVPSKQKTTPLASDRKGVRDKPKTEINNAAEKSTLKSRKTESSKKIKPVESTVKFNGESRTQDKKKIATVSKPPPDIEKEREGIDHQNALGNVVELKDILDSDEGTENDLGKSFDLSEPTAQELSLVTPDKVKNEPKETTINRPQSRKSRKPSALERQSETSNGTTDIKSSDAPIANVIDSQLGENISLKNHDNKFNLDQQENSINEPIEIKKPVIRTASSRSSKLKPEILKSAQSVSIDSRSDADLLDQSKSLSSNDSENRVLPRPRTSLRPPSVRPSSARPGAPRLKERNTDVIVTTSEPVLVGKVNVIVENYDNQPEDDEGSVEVMQITDDNISNSGGGDPKIDIFASGHGHLVQQILETQKELANEDAPKVEIEWEWGARKEREASYKEVESIRGGLQSLSRASNPLGKLMDYIQEDVEVMRQELIQWRDARLSAAAELKHQQSLTEQQVQPLLAKLKQLEDSIVEQGESIHTVKSNIHRNSIKILKLIEGDD